MKADSWRRLPGAVPPNIYGCPLNSVTDKDGVDSDCRSSGSGQQASREERVLDRYH